jgi:hypothetical protein
MMKSKKEEIVGYEIKDSRNWDLESGNGIEELTTIFDSWER